MSCFLLPPCLHKAVSLQSLAGLFVMALWKAQAGKMWGNFRLCVLILCGNVCFAWTVGLSLGALCGCPQWGSIVQMWAAETRPEGWLRVGPVPSSNLEPPGGCEAAFSVPFCFPCICLALQGSAPQRYLSSSCLDISGSFVPTQEIDSKHLS